MTTFEAGALAVAALLIIFALLGAGLNKLLETICRDCDPYEDAGYPRTNQEAK